MDALTEQDRFWIFFVVWGILGLASFWFYKNASVADKRRWHPWIAFAAGAVFIGFTYFVMPNVPPFFLLAVALIAWWNYKTTTFCDSCGAMLFSTGWGNKAATCQLCDAKLKIARGGKVADMSGRRKIFVGAMIIFALSVMYQMIPKDYVPFLPPVSVAESVIIAFGAFGIGMLACRCPDCGKFLTSNTGEGGFTPSVPECPRCHVPFK